MNEEPDLNSIIKHEPEMNNPWDGEYKIPWNDPDFSARMLAEHLSQNHDLASRRTNYIIEQVEWIHEVICKSKPKKILDLGCGPGFYLKQFAIKGYNGKGIDFSPASINYAKNNIKEDIELVCQDIRSAEFGANFDLISMIYGEFNVFSPDEISSILRKAFESLHDGGIMLIEPHQYEAVKAIGQARNTWYKAPSGLFSDTPHLCLIDNYWNDEYKVAHQYFHVIDIESGSVKRYRSTTKAWTKDEYEKLLLDAGFSEVYIEPDWPSNSDDLFLMRAVK